MTASLPLPVAHDRLLELARRDGLRQQSGCAALLELLATSAALVEALRHELGRRGVSPAGFGILTLLERREVEPLGTGDLAEHLHLPAATVSETLARLELDGLVSRRRRPGNRRHNTVELTAAGTHAINALLHHLAAELHRLTVPLNREELVLLHQFCARLKPAEVSSQS